MQVAMVRSKEAVMNGKEFFVSAPGRVACFTGVVALAGPGAMALSGSSPKDVSHVACILIVCILGLIATAVLSVYRFPMVSLAILFFGPLIGGVYAAGLLEVAGTGTFAGWVLVALALLPLATVIVAPFRHGDESKAPSASPDRIRAHA
jgi:hypothetical protein